MIVEIGHFALVLALAAALAQTIVPFWGARVGDIGLMNVGRNAALIQLTLIAVAFAALVNAHLTSDFSRSQRRREFERRDARDLQDLRRMGKP